MDKQELEIKFVRDSDASQLCNEQLKERLREAGFTLESEETFDLSNTYYDTANHYFENRKMGMRVRCRDGFYEQTVKSQTSVQGGLHRRQETNVELESSHPDLTLFNRNVWPDEPIPKTSDLTVQFSTNFRRITLHLSHAEGQCELVFDDGEVATEKDQAPIHEIEIELIDGKADVLFGVAKCLELSDLRLSDVSKAAQGFALYHGISNKIRHLPSHLNLKSDIATDKAFTIVCEAALSHWQYHEQLYFFTQSPKMLTEIAAAIRLLLQSVSLFLPLMQCDEMLSIHRQLVNYSGYWVWVDELKNLRFLMAKRGPFAKTMSRQVELSSYLKGRQKGLLEHHKPEQLLYSSHANAIKLDMMSLLTSKAWKKKAVGYEQPLVGHAKGWLSQGWQSLSQSIQSKRSLPATSYLTIETILRQTLFNALMVNDVLPESHRVAAPWQDLQVGIDELKALTLLRQVLLDSDLNYESGMVEWVDEKALQLLSVMERTREVALQQTIDWR